MCSRTIECWKHSRIILINPLLLLDFYLKTCFLLIPESPRVQGAEGSLPVHAVYPPAWWGAGLLQACCWADHSAAQGQRLPAYTQLRLFLSPASCARLRFTTLKTHKHHKNWNISGTLMLQAQHCSTIIWKRCNYCKSVNVPFHALSPRWQGCVQAAIPSGCLSGRCDPRRDWRRRARKASVSVLSPPGFEPCPTHLPAHTPGSPIPAGIRCYHGNHSHGKGADESERHPFRCVHWRVSARQRCEKEVDW